MIALQWLAAPNHIVLAASLQSLVQIPILSTMSCIPLPAVGLSPTQPYSIFSSLPVTGSRRHSTIFSPLPVTGSHPHSLNHILPISPCQSLVPIPTHPYFLPCQSLVPIPYSARPTPSNSCTAFGHRDNHQQPQPSSNMPGAFSRTPSRKLMLGVCLLFMCACINMCCELSDAF